VTKSAVTPQSVQCGALIVAGGADAEAFGQDPYMAIDLGEAYRHFKTIAVWGAGQKVLAAFSIPSDRAGVITADIPKRAVTAALIEALCWDRHWHRPPTTASQEVSLRLPVRLPP
jgi:C-terminal domain found in long catalases